MRNLTLFKWLRRAPKSNQINIQYYKTKIGELILGSYEEKLCLLDYKSRKMRKRIDKRLKRGLNAEYVKRDDKLLKETRRQIDQYLNGDREEFEIDFMMVGTDFQKKVWNGILKVKYGKVISYSELAKKIDHKKAARAVASANGANAINLVIPCHRIIGNNNELVGYGGGLPVKKSLLSLEDVVFNSQLEIKF